MLQFLQDVLRAEYGIAIDRLSRAFGMVFFRAKMGMSTMQCYMILTRAAFPSDDVKKVFQQGCAQVIEMLLTQVDDLVVRDQTRSPTH